MILTSILTSTLILISTSVSSLEKTHVLLKVLESVVPSKETHSKKLIQYADMKASLKGYQWVHSCAQKAKITVNNMS